MDILQLKQMLTHFFRKISERVMRRHKRFFLISNVKRGSSQKQTACLPEKTLSVKDGSFYTMISASAP